MNDDLFGVAGVPPLVCYAFEKFAFDIIAAGHDKYSARAILHRIRWHYQIEKGDRDYKCNNNWSAPLARWFMEKYPARQGFFETRKRRE